MPRAKVREDTFHVDPGSAAMCRKKIMGLTSEVLARISLNGKDRPFERRALRSDTVRVAWCGPDLALSIGECRMDA